MRHPRAKLLLYLVLAAPSLSVSAHDQSNLDASDWTVRTWTIRDGLPQNTVSHILQTRDGYLWIGTKSGLARFDGVHFRNYGLADGLPAVQITDLAEDASGRLWVATLDGGVCRLEKNRFVSLDKSTGLDSNRVSVLTADIKGNVWIGTEYGLHLWNEGGLKRIEPSSGLPRKLVHRLSCAPDGTIWVSILTQGLYRGRDGQFVLQQIPTPPIYALEATPDGTVWAGSGNSALWQLKEDRWTKLGKSEGIPFSYIASLAVSDGQVWVGTVGSGLFLGREGRFKPIPLPQTPENDNILSLCVDKDKQLWIGTAGGGLSRLTPRKVHHWGAAQGLKSVLLSLTQDSTNTIWAATHSGGAFRLQQGSFVPVTDPPETASLKMLNAAFTASDGSVWVGGSSCLIRYPPNQPPIRIQDDAIKNDAVMVICEDGQSIWVGTYFSKLLKVEGDKLRTVLQSPQLSGSVRGLIAQSPDNLWIASGADLHNWNNGKLDAWGPDQGLITPGARNLYRDTSGTLWIGTNGGGIARLANNHIQHITTLQGLRDNTVSQIAQDDFGHLWLGTNRGIIRVHLTELNAVADGRDSAVHPLLFGTDDGMLDEQCMDGQIPQRSRDGFLYFTTSRGVVRIDPRQWLSAFSKPHARIEDLLVDDRLIPANAPVTLPHNHRTLQIRYSGLSLNKPDSVSFRAQLEGHDADWIDTGARRSLTYGTLPPGNYILRVTACDSEGNWNPNPATLAIVVKPPWWETLWFRIAVAISVLSALLIGHFYRRNLRRRKEHARKAFTQQLLLSQEAERKRIASELHDGLGQNLLVIKNRLNMLESQASHWPDGVVQLAQISSNTSQALAEVREISHGLRPSAIEQVGLTHAIQWMIDQVSQTTDTRFSAELDNVDHLLTPDMEINLFRIAQEAINNVLKHAGASQVIITLKREDDQIALSVLDDGKGFDPDEHRNGNGSRPAFGLTGLKERADLLGGTISIQSAPGKGARLSLAVPLRGN